MMAAGTLVEKAALSEFDVEHLAVVLTDVERTAVEDTPDGGCTEVMVVPRDIVVDSSYDKKQSRRRFKRCRRHKERKRQEKRHL